jgi:hypothetical protein
MNSVKLEVEKRVVESYELKIGDYIKAVPPETEWQDIKGNVTYIFDNGRRCIIDDSRVIYTSQIYMINDVRIK